MEQVNFIDILLWCLGALMSCLGAVVLIVLNRINERIKEIERDRKETSRVRESDYKDLNSKIDMKTDQLRKEVVSKATAIFAKLDAQTDKIDLVKEQIYTDLNRFSDKHQASHESLRIELTRVIEGIRERTAIIYNALSEKMLDIKTKGGYGGREK